MTCLRIRVLYGFDSMLSIMRYLGSIIVAATIVAAVPSDAEAHASDVTATQAYLLAEYKFDRVVVSNLPASRRLVAAFVKKVAAECANVLVSPPRNEQLGQLVEEQLFALGIVASGSDRHSTSVFVRSIKSLDWGQRRLALLVQQRGRGVSVETDTVVPNLCVADRAWAMSDYVSLSASTKRFLEQMKASEPLAKGSNGFEPVQNVISRLLVPYERGHTRVLARQVKHLEARLEDSALEIILGASAVLSRTLGMVASG
jgi:hypothetical protein